MSYAELIAALKRDAVGWEKLTVAFARLTKRNLALVYMNWLVTAPLNIGVAILLGRYWWLTLIPATLAAMALQLGWRSLRAAHDCKRSAHYCAHHAERCHQTWKTAALLLGGK